MSLTEGIELTDDQLVAAHERLHGDVGNPAVVQAHHLVTAQLTERGIDHGHRDDEWAKAVIQVEQSRPTTLEKAVDGMPSSVVEQVRKELGNPWQVVVTTLLTVDGYTAKIDEVQKAEGFTPPESVRNAAARALKWIEEGYAGDGFTAVGRTRARQLAAGSELTAQTIKRMASYFARHEVDKQADGFYDSAEPSPGRVAWDAWGGDAGQKWVNSLTQRMEKDAAVALEPVQDALYRGLESVAEQIGGFDTGVGPTGAHYMDGDDNAFAAQGLTCANCVFFRGGGACEIVKGAIDPMGICKFWIIPANLVEQPEDDEYETEIEYLASLDEVDKAFFSAVAKMLDEGLNPEQELVVKGNPEALRDYWRGGGKGKINWGDKGDFTACVAAVSKYMSAEEAKGYCAIRHRETTGMWPGDKRNRMSKQGFVIDGTTATYSGAGNITYVVNLPGAEPMIKHPGNHDQKVHGKGGGAGESDEMTKDDLNYISQNLGARAMRIEYNEGYSNGQESASDFGQRALPRHQEALKQALTGLRASTARTVESESHSANVLREQGFVDGMLGRRRRLRMTLTSPTNPLYSMVAFGKSDSEPMIKHPGNHDQKVHAGGRGVSLDEGVAQSIVDRVRANGGLSVKMVDGSEPTSGYMVAKGGSKGAILDADDFYDPVKGPKALGDFMKQYKRDLGSGKSYLGLWHNKEDGKVYLDVSDNITDRAKAVSAGKRRNQISIWDVANFAEIATGGTGEINKGVQDGTAGGAASGGIHSQGLSGLVGSGDRRLGEGYLGEDHGQEGRVGFEPVVKHPGNHDQKVHAGGRGRSDAAGDERGPARPGMGDVGVSDEDFAAMAQGSAGPHILGRREDGSPIFTPERQALHDKIVSDIVDGVPSQSQPTYYMLGGGPAAGKSTMLNSGQVSVPTGKQAAQINADDIKEKIPEYDKMLKGGDKTAAAFTHEESSYLAKRAQAAAMERRQDVVLDGTGDSSESSLRGKVDKARKSGYRVEGIYATVPTAEAIRRSNDRGKETGRYVPESVIRGTHASVSRIFPAATKMFDRISLYDNSNGPRLIATASGGKLKIVDKDAYASFLAKGDQP